MGFIDKLRSGAVLVAVNALAVLAFVALALTEHRTTGYVLTGVAVVGLAWHALAHGFTETIAAQLLLAAAVLADYVDGHPPNGSVILPTAGGLVALLIADQPLISTVINRPRLRVANLPTLVIWGADDGVVPVAHGEAYAAALPNVRLEVLAECGHGPILEHPEKVASMIAKLI